jgi:hypothetical protein
VSPLAPATVNGLAALGARLQQAGLTPEAAQGAATAAVARSLEAHAQIAAFQDAYLLLAALFVLALPATWWIVRRLPGTT